MDKLQRQIDELREELQSMKSSASFPRDMGDAIAQRISDRDETIANMTRTGTASASMTRTATDSAGHTVAVPAYPDGYRVFRVGGKDIYVPYFNRS